MSFLDVLKELCERPENLDEEKIEQLGLESSRYFEQLTKDLQDRENKPEAKRQALEIKDYLENRLKRLFEETGLSLEDLVQMEGGEKISPFTEMVQAVQKKSNHKIKTRIN